jgi:hypothetical protein
MKRVKIGCGEMRRRDDWRGEEVTWRRGEERR